MKLIGVIWNSVYNQKREILDTINRYAKIEKCFDMELKYKLHKFINELYNYPPEEKWKIEIKYKGLKNYKNKTISIVILDIVPNKKILDQSKNRLIFKNVLALKHEIRNKFCYVIKNGKKQQIYSEDCFHLADDENEYNKQKQVVEFFLRK